MSARNGSSRAWRKVRAHVLDRDGHTCQIGWPGCTVHATHVDHIVPVVHGGTDGEHNLRAACARCNLSRGDGRRVDERNQTAARFLTGMRTPPPPMSSLSPLGTKRTRHADLPT